MYHFLIISSMSSFMPPSIGFAHNSQLSLGSLMNEIPICRHTQKFIYWSDFFLIKRHAYTIRFLTSGANAHWYAHRIQSSHVCMCVHINSNALRTIVRPTDTTQSQRQRQRQRRRLSCLDSWAD